MKNFSRIIVVSLALTALVACNSEQAAPDPTPEVEQGLVVSNADADYLAGTYAVNEYAIGFEATLVGDVKTVRFSLLDGTELVRIELGDTADTLRMWHYGVPQIVKEEAETSAETLQWLGSEEVQLVASMWREIQGTEIAELPAAEALVQYGIHADEVLGKMANEAVGIHVEDQDEEHRCSDCPGKCGPGCWSYGSNWYCENHDCCCDHYGSAACYSWCYAYPKCNHKSSC